MGEQGKNNNWTTQGREKKTQHLYRTAYVGCSNQAVERLLCKHEAPSSSLSPSKPTKQQRTPAYVQKHGTEKKALLGIFFLAFPGKLSSCPISTMHTGSYCDNRSHSTSGMSFNTGS
jgi:hypothetical protein